MSRPTKQASYADFISLSRRYGRSVHLERDLNRADAVAGYIPTARAVETLDRIGRALTVAGGTRAFTLTGVYGTGKSACAHFLTALVADQASAVRQAAEKVLNEAPAGVGKALPDFSAGGYVRAVATARKEPLTTTLSRALVAGAMDYWSGQRGRRPKVMSNVETLAREFEAGSDIEAKHVVALAQDIAAASRNGVLLILDELGKNLEFSVHSPDRSDLYVLQQLAELPNDAKSPVVVLVGILHQSFAEYGQTLAAAQRKEWGKVQGRFEDIPFTDSTEQQLRVVGAAIERMPDKKRDAAFSKIAAAWLTEMDSAFPEARWGRDLIDRVLPLHPLAARLLPELSARYAQNDRSLFSFLTSDEPLSFSSYLRSAGPADDGRFPTLRIDQLYDYFSESLSAGIASRPQFQRWLEVQARIQDATGRTPDEIRVLKAIGIFNLASTSGALRARWDLVVLSQLDDPADRVARKHWTGVLQALVDQGMVSYRSRADELRLWEGSDFDIQAEFDRVLTEVQAADSRLLAQLYHLAPHVAQRHSYQTGTLRYFESRFVGVTAELDALCLTDATADGVVAYWVGNGAPGVIPESTTDGRPLVVLVPDSVSHLWMAVREFVAIRQIQRQSPQLQTDGVARREVQERVAFAEQVLGRAITHAFGFQGEVCDVWLAGEQHRSIRSPRDFNAALSALCDRAYPQGLTLNNELLNRRRLTSQGAKARRELLEAMLTNEEQPQLGIEGFGPEYSMYASALRKTGVHREVGGAWEFGSPLPDSGLRPVWDAIEQLVGDANGVQVTVKDIFERLARPPFGVKDGPLPILLAAVLTTRAHDFSVFRDGSYIHTLGSEHFELLVKRPERFAIKHFRLDGIRGEVFKELESALRPAAIDGKRGEKGRNNQLLGVVAPLVRFATQLPEFTKKVRAGSWLAETSVAVRDALLSSADPERLVFHDLPVACGFPPFDATAVIDRKHATAFKTDLVAAIRDIHGAYPRLLAHGRMVLAEAFGVSSDESKVREDLRVRARHLGQVVEPRLLAFLNAAKAEDRAEQAWLESLLLIVADRPAETWGESDVLVFESKLADLARRFKSLEALVAEVGAREYAGAYDARRVTITRPDGGEIQEVVWVDEEQKERVAELVDKMLADIDLNDKALRRAFVASLVSKVYAESQDAGQPKAKKGKKAVG